MEALDPNHRRPPLGGRVTVIVSPSREAVAAFLATVRRAEDRERRRLVEERYGTKIDGPPR